MFDPIEPLANAHQRPDEPDVAFDGASSLPTLDTPRVRLRALVPGDAPAIFAVGSSPEVARYLSRPAFTELAQAEALLAEIEAAFRARTLFQWGVARREDDRVIGTVTLLHLALDHGRAELGYVLGREHWGQGLMREALEAALRLSFEGLGLRRLEADIDPRNVRSLRIAEALGFVREGYLRERFVVAGEIQDTVMLGLLAREWRARVERA